MINTGLLIQHVTVCRWFGETYSTGGDDHVRVHSLCVTLVRVRAFSRLPFLCQRPDRLVCLYYVSVESGRKTACSDHFRFKSRFSGFFCFFFKGTGGVFKYASLSVSAWRCYFRYQLKGGHDLNSKWKGLLTVSALPGKRSLSSSSGAHTRLSECAGERLEHRE